MFVYLIFRRFHWDLTLTKVGILIITIKKKIIFSEGADEFIEPYGKFSMDEVEPTNEINTVEMIWNEVLEPRLLKWK